MLSTENNVRPNRDDSDHVLIMAIDVDQMQLHSVTRHNFSQSSVGRMQIAVRHD
jgi:hypothetical protein